MMKTGPTSYALNLFHWILQGTDSADEGWLEQHKVNQKLSQSASSPASCKVCHWLLGPLFTQLGLVNEYSGSEAIFISTCFPPC